jgi:hypothetical protein
MALTDRNGMIVRIAANIDELKKTLADGTRAISVTTDSMRKLASSLEGASLERQAHNITAAINEIGGVTKLTDAEAARHLRTLDAWVQKAGLIGKQVPTDILRTRDALVRVDEVTDKLPAKTIDWKNALTSVAGLMGITFSAGAVIAFGKHVFDSASQIHDMSEKLGISTDAVQGFKFAAEQSGSTLDNVGVAINKMNDNLSGGNKATVQALNMAGLSFQTIRSMKPEDAFLAIADAIQKMPDPMQQADVAMALFGKSAASLLPAIKEGFRAAADGADKMSKETIKSLEAAQDAWGKLSNKVTIYTGEIIANILKNRTFTAQYERDQREHGTQFANDMADIATRAAEHAGKIYAPFKQPPPPEIQKTAEELAAIGKAAKKAAEKAAAYAAVVAEINAATVPLTVTQKAQIRTLETLGVSVGTIAKYLHLTEAPIGKFNDDLKEVAKSIDQIGKQVLSIPHNVPIRLVTENLSGAVPMIDVKAVKAASEGLKQIHAATFDEIESRMRANGVFTQAVLAKNAAVAREQFESMKASGQFTALELEDAFVKANQAIAKANGQSADGFKAMASTIQQLAQIGGQSFSGILQGVGGIVAGLAAAKQANIDWTGSSSKGFGIANALFSANATASQKWSSAVASGGAIVSGAMSVWSATANDGTKAAGALHGAMSGAKAGAVFGPYGMAVGAAAGAIVGMIHTLTAGRRAVEDFAKSFDTAAAGSGFDELHAKMARLEDGEARWIKLTQQTKKGDKAGALAQIAEIQAALDKLPVIVPIDVQIKNAGFETRADLEAIEATAKKVYDAMVTSGLYTSDVLAKAFQAYQDAAVAAGDNTVIATKKAQDAITEMDGKIKSLTESIANEAPEEVMGIVEANTRAQIDAIAKQRDAAQAAIDQTTTTAADAAAKAGDVIDAALAAREYHIKVRVDLDGLPGGEGSVPGFQHGSAGVRDFGRGQFVVLHGHEEVRTEAQVRSGVGAGPVTSPSGGGDIYLTTQTILDGKVLDERTEKIARRAAATGRLKTRASAGRTY